MLTKLFRFFALVFWLFACQPVFAQDYASRLALGDRFVSALKQRRFDDAAAMFAPAAGNKESAGSTSAVLNKIAAQIGGFETMKAVFQPLTGKSRNLEVWASPKPVIGETVSFMSICFETTSKDGARVYYVVAFTPDSQPAAIRSLTVQIPTADAEAEKHADRLIAAMDANKH